MPTTPLCQRSLYTTQVFLLFSNSLLLIISRACMVMLLSVSFLSLLSACSMSAYTFAFSGSFSMKSCTAFLPSSILPAALTRGAITKTTFVIVIAFLIPASSMRAFIPGRGSAFIFCNPKKAKILFSPVIGTISAAIAIDTKSK